MGTGGVGAESVHHFVDGNKMVPGAGRQYEVNNLRETPCGWNTEDGGEILVIRARARQYG